MNWLAVQMCARTSSYAAEKAGRNVLRELGLTEPAEEYW